MPEAKKRTGEHAASRITEAAQLAMVQAGVIAMEPPGTLQRWKNEGKVTRAHYASELAGSNRAHWQAWHEWDTEQPQSAVPAGTLRELQTASGSKKTKIEQKVRNQREALAVAELRKCAPAWDAGCRLCVCASPARVHLRRRWVREDVVAVSINLELCSYSCTINIVKEGDEVKTMGYPGKEQGQSHLRTATIGISEQELREAIEVKSATPPLAVALCPYPLGEAASIGLPATPVHPRPAALPPSALSPIPIKDHMHAEKNPSPNQVAQAEAGDGRAANDKQNHTPGARKKRKMITRKNESLTSSWFAWREGIDLLQLPLEQVCGGGGGDMVGGGGGGW